MFRCLVSQFICLLVFSVAITLTSSCSKNQDEPVPVSETTPIEIPVPVVPEQNMESIDPINPNPTEESIKSPVATLLGWTPDKAQIAIGIPTINGTVDKVISLAKKAVTNPYIIDDVEQQMVSEISGLLGSEEADSLGALLATKGIDLEKPTAVFIDYSSSLRAAMRLFPTGTGAVSIDADQVEVEPALLFAFSVLDGEVIENAVQELFKQALNDSDDQVEERQVGAVKQFLYPAVSSGYFIHDGYLLIGDQNLLQSAAEHIADPLSLSYGTNELPPESEEEIVYLVFGNRLIPYYKDLAENAPIELRKQFDLQVSMMERLLGTGGVEDPLIGTLNLTEDKLELSSFVNSTTHPGLLEVSGEPKILEFLAYQPENTMAVLALNLTEPSKLTLQEQMHALMGMFDSESSDDSDVVTLLDTALNAIGEEIVISSVPGEAYIPKTLGMIKLKDVVTAKILLGAKTVATGNVYREIPISNANDIPYPVLTAVVEDTLLVSDALDLLEQTIDRVMDNEKTEFVAKLEPALDLEKKYYSSFIILNSDDLQSSLMALVSVFTGNLVETDASLPPDLERPVNLIRQIRATSSLEEAWITSKFSIFFAP